MDRDYEYPIAGWVAATISEDDPLELLYHRWEKNREAGELFIGDAHVHQESGAEFHERWQGLMEDIRRRSSSFEADSWEALWDEEEAEPCPSLDERAQSRSPSARYSPAVTRSEEEPWADSTLGGEGEGEDKDQPLLSPYPRPRYLRLPSLTRPAWLPHTDAMAPHRNTVTYGSDLSSTSSLGKSLDVSTSPGGMKSQAVGPPGGRPMTIQMHEEPSIVHSFSYHSPTHSYCESAILEPNSPPRRQRQPSLSGFSEAEDGEMRSSRLAANVSTRQSFNAGHHDQRRSSATSPALKLCNRLLGAGHPHNSDVSLLDLGPGAVTEGLGTLSIGANDASSLGATVKLAQETLAASPTSLASRRTLPEGMRVPILRTNSTALSSDTDTTEASALSPTCCDSVAVFHLDEDLAKLDAVKAKHKRE